MKNITQRVTKLLKVLVDPEEMLAEIVQLTKENERLEAELKETTRILDAKRKREQRNLRYR